MQFGRVLIYCRRGLGATIAFRVVEVQGTNGILAERAFKGDAAVHPIGGVVAHNFIVVAPRLVIWGKRC
jgi:hypothetical protein